MAIGNPSVAGEIADAARAFSAASAAGLERIRAFNESDGALPAVHKALFTAAAAATQSQPTLLRRSLARARDLGLAPELAAAAGRIVLLDRGEEALHTYAQAAQEVFGELPVCDEGASPVTASVDEALDYYRDHFGGQVPERQLLFAELAPQAFEGYYLMHRAGLKDNLIPSKLAELLLCTVIAAEYLPALLEIHVRSARAEGATDAELAEAILCAVPVGGFQAWAGAAAAISNTRTD